ncbi:MAG: hypothetical protein R3D82_13135, partial [Xanthobacteraceae bacterium]
MASRDLGRRSRFDLARTTRSVPLAVLSQGSVIDGPYGARVAWLSHRGLPTAAPPPVSQIFADLISGDRFTMPSKQRIAAYALFLSSVLAFKLAG